mgnify:CR=1 FL=1
MKKEKMVTRTIVTTIANCKYYNLKDETLFDSSLTYTGKLDEKQVKTEINGMIERNPEIGYTLVKVNYITYEEKLYGMPESVFLVNATELPPRKNNETQEDE